MKVDFAKEEEISMAKKLLLPPGKKFCEERRKIILCNETADINACPGSGKTTVLLAKLVILAKSLPLPANQGICVLTHTNVAINEIKKKLGRQSDILFSYPNHFGTIQSFVDKFLTIPCFVKCYGGRPNFIDSGRFFELVEKKYESTRWLPKGWLNPQGAAAALASYRFNFRNINIISKTLTGEIIVSNTNGTAYKNIKKFKLMLLKSGYLNFDDAYSLAAFYLKKYPQLKAAFSNRFKYLFIDEMQDTDEHQITILDKIFDRDKVIIQRFGDPHQTIFKRVKLGNFWNIENELKITASKRFGENIAKVLRAVCIVDNNALKPNNEISSLQPHIIVYNDPKEVLPKFCELLTTLKIGEHTIWEYGQLPENKNKPIKAVGWVGKEKEKADDDKYNIQSYWQHYQKDVKKPDRYSYDALKTFIKKLKTNHAKDYYQNFLEAFMHILSLAEKSIRQKHEKEALPKPLCWDI